MKQSTKAIEAIQVIPHMCDNPTQTPAPDSIADVNTISLLNEVTALRTQLRTLEPILSRMITDYGMRRGYRGYREFYLRNELNAQAYKEK